MCTLVVKKKKTTRIIGNLDDGVMNDKIKDAVVEC